MTAYLHPDLLSPDPTIAAAGRRAGVRELELDVYPNRLVRHSPALRGAAPWARRLNLHRDPGPLVLTPDASGRAELLLDFGTELHAWLELTLRTDRAGHVMAAFGEHPLEAEGLIPCTEPRPELVRAIPAGARVAVRFDEIRATALGNRSPSRRGFRFVRLVFHGLPRGAVLRRACAHAIFTFRERRGEFRCDNPSLQRAWQTSLYTARVCTQPDAIWDGIKRDRSGWFGDARITQMAIDAVYHDPAPVDAMLPLLPSDNWVNGVPGFSFDGIAMLAQRMLAHGADAPAVRDCYARVSTFLGWVRRRQTNRDGFIVRSDDLKFFAGIGFLDWSRFPVGGRFEELSWLQCKYVEGLRTAARIARWLGRSDDADRWDGQADRLGRLIRRRFWDSRRGLVHTLNHAEPVAKPLKHGDSPHYRLTYEERVRNGPSGPSRQANALAVLAGICTADMQRVILERVLSNPAIAPIITAYFRYFESLARARCGDPAGALRGMADYVAGMIESEDAATVWEVYDPRVRDLSRYYGGFDVTWDWEITFCHGWGSGLVPLVERLLLGIQPAEPGFRSIRLTAPASPWRMAFDAVVPTPLGDIRVRRESPAGPLDIRLPRGIAQEGPVPEGVCVEATPAARPSPSGGRRAKAGAAGRLKSRT